MGSDVKRDQPDRAIKKMGVEKSLLAKYD